MDAMDANGVREFEYQRHGIAVLSAALSVHEGTTCG
jgi:hypothetical protein